eukprot:5325_1
MVEVMPVMRILVGIVLLLSSSCVLAANKNDLGKVFVVSSKDRKKSIELPFDFNSPVSDLRVVILNPDNCSKLGISCGKELILKLNGRKLDGNTSLSDQHYRPGQAVVVEVPPQPTLTAKEQSDKTNQSDSGAKQRERTGAIELSFSLKDGNLRLGTHSFPLSDTVSAVKTWILSDPGFRKALGIPAGAAGAKDVKLSIDGRDLNPNQILARLFISADEHVVVEYDGVPITSNEDEKDSGPGTSNSGDEDEKDAGPEISNSGDGMAPGAKILIVFLILIIVIGIFCLIDYITNDGEYVKKYANQAVALFGGAALTATAVTTTSQSVPGEGIIDPVVSAVSGIDLGLVLAITIPATILVFTIVVLLLEFFNVIHIEFVASVLDGMKNLGRVGLSKISVSNSVAVKTSSDMSNSAISDDPDSNDIDLESGRAQ